MPRGMTDLERVMALITKEKGGHWIWRGSKCGNKRQYGQVRFRGKKMVAHKVAWILLRGELPDGHEMLHKCPFTLCCNPAHLATGTHKENVRDSIDAGTHYFSRARGQHHPKAIIPDAEIPKIIAACKVRGQQKVQAEKYGVTQAYISMIVNGKYRS